MRGGVVRGVWGRPTGAHFALVSLKFILVLPPAALAAWPLRSYPEGPGRRRGPPPSLREPHSGLQWGSLRFPSRTWAFKNDFGPSGQRGFLSRGWGDSAVVLAVFAVGRRAFYYVCRAGWGKAVGSCWVGWSDRRPERYCCYFAFALARLLSLIGPVSGN